MVRDLVRGFLKGKSAQRKKKKRAPKKIRKETKHHGSHRWHTLLKRTPHRTSSHRKNGEIAPTGNKELDALIGGGLVRNSINLIAGGPGTGKTIFSVQFLVEGILRYHENGLYLTFEENKEKFYKDMLSLGWDLAKLEEQGKFVFLEYKPEQVKNLIERGGGIIEDIIREGNIKRIVIDSITSFALLYEDALEKKESALNLFEMIGRWGCTALLCSQDTSLNDDLVIAALEFEVDSIILLYNIKHRGRRKRAIEILKMRGKEIPNKTMRIKIYKGGVKIYPDKIVDF